MTKYEFMKTLEELLTGIPIEEKQEALKFYECYFEDAGPEHEQDIIMELGSPEKVAAIIKGGINTNTQDAQSRGYFTEKGFEDDSFREPKYEMLQRAESSNAQNNDTRGEHNNTSSRLILIIILCIFALPIGIPLVSTVFGIIVASFFTVVGISIAFIVMSFVFTILGIGISVIGFIKIVTVPIIGLILTGAGLILFGLGLLTTVLTVGLCTKVVPAVFRFFINICRLPFKNRRVMA